MIVTSRRSFRRLAATGVCAALVAVPLSAASQVGSAGLDSAAHRIESAGLDSAAHRIESAGLDPAMHSPDAGLGASPQAMAPVGQRAVIGTAQLAATRVQLTAIRTGKYTATVRLKASTLTKQGWKSAGSLRVGKRAGWFWFVVSRPFGVCALSVGEHKGRPITVRLSISPSIGCAKARHFDIRRGELVRA
jgi:hypothetical protein